MTYDVADLFMRHERERYAMHLRHLNGQMVKVLQTIGYDVDFCRGKGQYLYDRQIKACQRSRKTSTVTHL